MARENKLEKILKDHRYSLTRQRLAIFNVLSEIEEPISVVNLVDKLPEVDKVSVYRTVDLFEKVGIIHRVWTGFKSKIELSEDFSSHHHHFTCINCGKTINLSSDRLESDLHQLEKSNNFKLVHHSVELSGFCNGCKEGSTLA